MGAALPPQAQNSGHQNQPERSPPLRRSLFSRADPVRPFVSSWGHRFRHGRIDREELGQSGDLKNLEDPRFVDHDPKFGTAPPATVVGVDKYTKPRGVDEGNREEIYDHRGAPRVDGGIELLAQIRSGGDVNLPSHRNGLGPARVAFDDSEALTHNCPFSLVRSVLFSGYDMHQTKRYVASVQCRHRLIRYACSRRRQHGRRAGRIRVQSLLDRRAVDRAQGSFLTCTVRLPPQTDPAPWGRQLLRLNPTVSIEPDQSRDRAQELHYLRNRGELVTVVTPNEDHVALEARRSVRRKVSATEGDRAISPVRATALVLVVGLLISVSGAWAAWTLNRHNEHRLLEVQTRQAVAVLNSAILGIRDPLMTALQIQMATGGSAAQFEQFAAAYVGPGHLFDAAVLLRAESTSWKPTAYVGAKPVLSLSSNQAIALMALAQKAPYFAVQAVQANGSQRNGYVMALQKGSTFIIYAERAIPADRQTPVESNSAFADLNFATYLGRSTRMSALRTTDVPLSQLPLAGDTVRETIPVGNTSVTLVTSARSPLGGSLGGAVPWIFLVGGLLLTMAMAAITDQLVTRRRRSRQDALTIAGLYDQLDGLYGKQRSIAETLQQALLPKRNPSIPNLDIASRYIAGADGVDIGGDWYSLIEVDEHRFAFAVGDVSGKGVGAAAVMARLRFTVRAYLTEGHPPDAVLAMCSRQLSVSRDGHLSTVLVGCGDLRTGSITIASAGHLNPLMVSGRTTEFVQATVGLPLGVEPTTYTATTIQMAHGSTLVAFTDGLVERRGESIDVGLGRLARAASTSDFTPEDLLSALTSTVAHDGADDDIAVLAFRWWDPDEPRERPDSGQATDAAIAAV
jgi:serine phosphatase RsbU (regulator of sigma subunit)